MRAWLHALKVGLRQLVALELVAIITGALVLLIFNGFAPPPKALLIELLQFQLALLFFFPVLVLVERYEVWRNNQVKPTKCSRRS
jgi:hypothetical protein